MRERERKRGGSTVCGQLVVRNAASCHAALGSDGSLFLISLPDGPHTVLSPSHLFSLFLSFSLTFTLSHTFSHSLSLSHTFSHTLSPSIFTFSHSLALLPCRSLSLLLSPYVALPLSLPPFRSFSHALTFALVLSCQGGFDGRLSF